MTKEYRIYGPPGTGKTTALAAQIARAADTFEGEEILVASFTKAAAIELNHRALPIPEENIGTLHAICYRLLGRGRFAGIADGESKWTTAFNEWQRRYKLSGGAKVDINEPLYQQNVQGHDALLIAYNNARHRREDIATFEARIPGIGTAAIAPFAEMWEGFKRSHNLLDFTDMIKLTLDEGLVPHDIRVGFFDEVQDFTPLELAVVRMWGNHFDYIVLAGDDDQCIYDFKGAQPEAFLYPDIPEENKRFLEQSYRMPPAIHLYSQQWINKLETRQNKWFRPRMDEEGEVVQSGIRYSDKSSLIRLTEQIRESGEQSHMVLASCGYMLVPIMNELRWHGIPFHNPYSVRRRDWNPLQRRRNSVSTAERVAAFFEPFKGRGRDYLWTYAELRRWSELVKATGTFRRGVLEGLKAPPGGNVVTEIESLFEPQAYVDMLDNPGLFLGQRFKKDKETLGTYCVNIVHRSGYEALTETPRVIVGTIHSVKGGQADNVLLFPDLSPKGVLNSTPDSLRRQFYVGMTRARSKLTLGAAVSARHKVWLPTPEV